MRNEYEKYGDVIAQSLRSVIQNGNEFVSLHEPEFQGNEWTYLKECLDTGWVSSVGKYVDKFERDLEQYTESRHAVAVVNGTAALHICLLLAGVKPNDEVIIPSLTFIATANAVSYCGAIPHFADVSLETLGLDAARLDSYLKEITETTADGQLRNRITGRRIKAVIPMHTFGHPVDLDLLIDVCNKYGLDLIEDAAESIGSTYRGRQTGTFGKLAAVSFNGNKVITTGGGGAILTQDEGLARAAKHLTTTAKIPHKWTFEHDSIGYNYRMPNINAALGCAQLERLPEFLGRKRNLTEQYRELFLSLDGISLFLEPWNCNSNYWLNVLLLDQPDRVLRDAILKQTNEAGIMTRPVWTPMHRLKLYEECPRMDLKVTEELEDRIINIPSGHAIMRDRG